MNQETNKVTVRPNISNNYKIMLCEDIEAPSAHEQQLAALYEASANDTVDLYINSGGGYMYTAIQLIDAISLCPAVVSGHLVGEAYSAASMIFLACDQWRVTNNAHMMIHSSSRGEYGKEHEMESSYKFEIDNSPIRFESWYKHFLSNKEIKEVLGGKDIHLNADQIIERLQVLSKARAKQNKQLLKG